VCDHPLLIGFIDEWGQHIQFLGFLRFLLLLLTFAVACPATHPEVESPASQAANIFKIRADLPSTLIFYELVT
jgi:hypothetical protein